MIRKLFKKRSKFLSKMNTLMELYATTHNASSTYKQLLDLETLIQNDGELAMFHLNQASLLFDLKEYRKATDILLEIPPLNPEFDARVANLKTMLMDTNIREKKEGKY